MGALPQHRTLVVFDIEAFGTRNDGDQRWLRGQLYELLESAADRAGFSWSRCDVIDRGDGVALLIRASVSKQAIAERFVPAVQAMLRAHNRRCHGPAAMRWRMSLHAGEVHRDPEGWVGADLNTACRLVDVPDLREALSADGTAQLAICVSDLWYQTVIRHNPGLVDPTAYLPIAVMIKELDTKAWLHVP